MRKRVLFALVALLCCWAVDAVASTLTEDEALQIVKNNRIAEGLSNTDVNFYIAEVDTIVNNYRCPVDVNTITDAWVTDNTSKWLVFVDEEPLKLWNHHCTYYYINKAGSTGTVKYEGILPPEANTCHPVEMNAILDASNFPTLHFPNRPRLAPSYNTATAADSIYVVLAANSYTCNGILKLYHNMSMIYKMLTQIYSIPKSHIRIVCGNGFDEEGNTLDHFQHVFYLDKDIDGDGEEENIESYEFYNQILAEESNSISHPDCRQLFIFTAKDGGAIITGGQNTPNDNLFGMAERAVNLFYFAGGGDNYINENLNYNKSITAPLSNTEQLSDGMNGNLEFDNFDYYSPILCNWVSALCGIDVITGSPVNADYNNDGIISMNEASFYMGCVRCQSIPSNLASELSFATSPLFPKLIIRDNAEDVGIEPNTTSDIIWNSPDIWIRNQNDGFINQESEHLTNDGETKYIYVRIHNKGEHRYEDGLKLYLAAVDTEPSLSAIPLENYQCTLIDSIPITSTIDCGACAVLEYEVGLYSPDTYGGILKNDLIAVVDYKTPSFFAEESCTPLPNPRENNNFAISKFSKINPRQGSLHWTIRRNDAMYFPLTRTGITLPINIVGNNGDDDYILEIRCSDSNNQYQSFTIGIEMTQELYDEWQSRGGIKNGFTAEPGNPNCMILSASNARLANIITDSSINLKCYDSGLRSVDDHMYNFDLILRNRNAEILDGLSFSLYEEGLGTSGPIIIFGNNNGQMQLSASNVATPSSLEWLNESNDLVGEGEILTLNNPDVQNEYTLLATDNETGYVSSASIDMNTVNALNTVNCVGDNVAITLWRPANSSTSIRITPLNNNENSTETSVEVGSQAVIIPNIHNGMYVISLIVNDSVIESKSIIK